MRRFKGGFFIYFSGIRFWLSEKSLLRLSVIPFILDFACLAVGLSYVVMKLPMAVAYLVHQPHFWYQYIIYYFVYALTAFTLFFVTLFMVTVVTNLIAFPFNDLLSQKTLSLKGVLTENPSTVKNWLSRTSTNLNVMLKKTIVLMIVGCLLILATLIPGLGVVAGFVGVFLMTYELCDYSFDHFHLTFSQRRAFVKENLPAFLGFSLGLGLTTAVPVINILILPGGVVAAACLIAEARGKT